MIEPLLTIEEVSQIIKVPVRTIYVRGAGTKTLPRVKIGHTLRFRESDVRDWINRNTERPGVPKIPSEPRVPCDTRAKYREILAEHRLQKRFKKSA